MSADAAVRLFMRSSAFCRCLGFIRYGLIGTKWITSLSVDLQPSFLLSLVCHPPVELDTLGTPRFLATSISMARKSNAC